MGKQLQLVTLESGWGKQLQEGPVHIKALHTVTANCKLSAFTAGHITAKEVPGRAETATLQAALQSSAWHPGS